MSARQRLASVLVGALAALTSGPGPAGAEETFRLEPALRRANAQAASRLVVAGAGALRKKQSATGYRILRRALELDGGHARARTLLGFVRRNGEWILKSHKARRGHKDGDAKEAAKWMAAARKAETRWADEVVRLVGKAGGDHRELLLGVLKRVPLHAGTHEALGHPKVGKRYVRPSLARAVQTMVRLEARFGELRRSDLGVVRLPRTTVVPGTTTKLTYFRCKGRLVATSLEPQSVTAELARRCAVVNELVKEIWGEAPGEEDKRPVLFLTGLSYARMIDALFADAKVRAARRRSATLQHQDYFAILCRDVPSASDLYAHSIGFYSMQAIVTPAEVKDEVRWKAHPWLCEAFGYLLSLELFNRAETWFYSEGESSGKVRVTVPPPDIKSKRLCLQWVRGQILDGSATPLRDVLSRSLNNLDFLSSMQAWTFLRFLLYYDPKGLRKLPAEMRKRLDGPMAERAAGALEAAFGKTLDELEPLWRAFTLEIR